MVALKGAMTALVTPFRDGAVDENALRALVESQIEDGIHGLVPCGTTGESVTLTHDEYARVVRAVVEQTRGRVPVVAGAGSNSTRHTIELSETARDAGADALLLVVPYYNRPTQEGLVRHYETAARAVPLPIVLYNIPARTGVDLSVDTLGRLAEVETIVAVKEATGNAARSAEIAARFGDRFTIFSGDDALTVPIMAVGGEGVISVASNVVPGEVAGLANACAAGDYAAARVGARRLAPLFQAMFIEANPGPVKAALALLGRMTDEVRLPLVSPSDASRAQIRSALVGLGLL